MTYSPIMGMKTKMKEAKTPGIVSGSITCTKALPRRRAEIARGEKQPRIERVRGCIERQDAVRDIEVDRDDDYRVVAVEEKAERLVDEADADRPC